MNKVDVEIPAIELNTSTFKNEKFYPNLVNFIFGNNGTGKSTIAKEIFKLQPSHSNCEFLLFNQEYKQRNLKDLNGIYTLNEKNIEIETQIKTNEDKINKLKIEIDEKESEKETIEIDSNKEDDDFRNTCKEKCKDIQKRCDKAFEGAKQINSLLNKIENYNPIEHKLEDLYKLYDIAYGSDDTTYDLLETTPTEIKSNNLEGYKLLNISIVNSEQSNFNSYLKKIDAFDWVLEGYKKLDSESNICPFCQRELTDEIKQSLKDCFNEEFNNNINELSNFAKSYNLEWQPIFNKLRRNTSKYIPVSFKAQYETQLNILEQTIKHNLSEISLKQKEPSKMTTIDDIDVPLKKINDLIILINNEIENHNNIILTKKESKKECINKLFEYIKFTLKDDILKHIEVKETFDYEISSLDEDINDLNTNIHNLKNEIDLLNSKTINTSEVVKNINNLLALSGYQGFKLQEVKTSDNISKYSIIRENGEIATDSLSEGEENFISFLYFYYQVKCSDTITPNNNKIVIIDDPVSSMDSNSLYIISSLVKEMIDVCASNYSFQKDKKYGDYIYQLFILTHNIYFHNEITQHQEANSDYVSFFMLSKESNISRVIECINKNLDGTENIYNPVGNSYTLLWQEYKETNSPMNKLNLIKRILDYYFIQFSGYKEGDLIEKIMKNDDGFVKKDNNGNVIDSSNLNIAKALINQVSAYGRFNEDIYFSGITKETVSTYEYVFKLIFNAMGQDQHYKMMMGEND